MRSEPPLDIYTGIQKDADGLHKRQLGGYLRTKVSNMMKHRALLWIMILLGISFLFLCSFRPSQMPPPWFDEGWTLSVARTWVETGQYARLLSGEPVSAAGMTWNFPVTGPVALSFRLLGIGIWQGRLPSALFTIASIWLIYLLARRMYGERIAVAAVLVLILGFPFPLLLGRQAIGEPAMIFYLLAGYYAFWMFLEGRSILSIAGSMLVWGAALATKLQTLPFWIVSMLAVVMFAGLRRDRFTFGASLGAILGTLGAWRGMLAIQAWLEADLPVYIAPMQGLLTVTGWVPIREIRIQAVNSIIFFATPLILGFGYILSQEIHAWKMKANQGRLPYLRLAHGCLTISWLSWYAALAMPWDRYLYPVVFFGSVFVAAFIFRITNGFKFSQLLSLAGKTVHRDQFKRENLQALLVILILSYMGGTSIRNFAVIDANNDAEEIAAYLNHSTSSDTLIETYDSELLFLVQRPFHFPPDQIQVELNKRTFLGQNVAIPYDPMLANPDYLVIGPYSKMWRLYEGVLEQQSLWKLIYELPSYSVYQRVTE